MNSRVVVLVLLGLSLAACRKSRVEPARAEVAKAKPGAAAALPSALPAPSQAPNDAASPLEAPSQRGELSVALAAHPPEYPNFYGDGVFAVYSVRGADFVSLGEQLFRVADDKLVEEETGGLGRQFLVSGGFDIPPIYAEIYRVEGRYPHGLWVSVSGMWVSDGARIHSAYGDTYVERDGGFARVGSRQAGYGATSLVAWSGGRSVAFGPRGLELVDGRAGKGLPQLRTTSAGSPRLAVTVIGALPSGEFYALGRDTEPPKQFALEHWNDEQRESLGFHALPEWFCPGVEGPPEFERPVRILAAAPGSVYLLCLTSPALMRFDGTTLRPLPVPTRAALHDAAVASDGSLWLVAEKSVFSRAAEGAWKEWSAPSVERLSPLIEQDDSPVDGALKLTLTSVLALPNAKALVSATLRDEKERAQSTLLFGNDDRKLQLPSPPKVAAATPPVGSAAPDAGSSPPRADSVASAPLTPDCATPFVLLYSVSDTAPSDYAYPATRDAVASAKVKPNAEFVEFRYKRHRTLGARLKSASDANALVELIQARVKGSKPTPLCLDPAPSLIRKLEF